MSQTQVEATELLCRLLEQPNAEINGQTLCEGDNSAKGRHLLHEKVLVSATPLEYVTCPECGIDLARVVREISHNNILLACSECGEITVSRLLQETYKPSLSKIIQFLLVGLRMTENGKKIIDPETSWRLGTNEPTRGKPLTWYFARHLHKPKVAQHLLEQIKLDKAIQSCRIITCSELPLPDGSPVKGLDVANLATIARIGQSKFEFFTDRMIALGPQILKDALPITTLLYVEPDSKVFIEGEAYDLEPRQRLILLALISDRDHEMDKDALKSACNSNAQRFSPSKEFDRIPIVYHTFIRFQRGDDRYALLIPEEDKNWLY